MYFVVFALVIGLFCLGAVLAYQGFLRKEPSVRWDLQPYTRPFDRTTRNPVPPPEKHPVRLMLIGVGMMISVS